MVTTGLEVVGRDDELAVLVGFLDGSPPPRILLLEGEAGIGKTTLWREGVAYGERRGLRILTCSPSESEAQLPFAAAGDLLGPQAASVLDSLPLPQRRALAAALLLEELEGPAPEPRAVALAFLGALRVLAQAEGLLVAVDDVQWLDGPSALLLEFALRRIEDEPVKFLFAQRPSGASDAPLGLERAPEGAVRALPVGPLTMGALHRLLRARLQSSFPRPLLRRLQEASGGNPFYALELGRTLAERDVEPDPGLPLPVPTSLQELVRDRIARHPAQVRDALATVAALSAPTVFAVGDDAALDAAAAAELIELDGDRVRFTHPLLAAEAYAAAGAQRRRSIHRRLADVVRDVEERARHLALAAERPAADVAAAVEEAADRAAARGAPEVAAELSALAVRLTPHDATSDRLRRRLATADFQILAGAPEPARAAAEELLSELPAGAERAGVFARLMRIASRSDFRAALDLSERTLAEPGIDEETRALVYRDRGQIWMNLGDLSRARAELVEAADSAERSGSAFARAEALGFLGLFDAFAGEPRPPEFWKRARAFEDDLGGRAISYGPLQSHGIQLMYAERLDEGRAALEEAYRRAETCGDDYALGTAQLHLVELEVRAGDLESARRYADSFFQVLGQAGYEVDYGAALYGKSLVDAYQGRVDEARAALEEGVALAESSEDRIFLAQNLAVLGFLELSLGRAAEAARVLRPLWDELAGRGHAEPSVYPVLPNAVEALVATGEFDEARRELAQLEELGRTLDSPWALSQAARCRGQLAAAEGDSEAALPHFEEALSEHARMPGPFERARTLLALGQARRRLKRKRVAREALTEALSIFEQVGTPLWAEKARVELGRIGGRAAPREGGLTATERAIADLVVAGHTNDEVAAALSLSPRTVQWNLSKIYRKVGVRSRTELAAALPAVDHARGR
ncbi:MAG TPA: AAA family ATPase [Gaiellaceae bacterium]|nr:AAA family ATPase [Gaiellaceae bacterium]